MPKMLALLVHLGTNMWNTYNEEFVFDEEVWDKIINKCAEYKFTHIVLDIGEGIRYESHPEFAVEGAWEPERVKQEVVRLKEKGITLIPKLNFSAAHDLWLKEYGREKMSTPEYYEVCKNLINELYEIFDSPEYIHLGLDEESPDIATPENFYRTGKKYLEDYKYLVDCVKETGATPCFWNSPFLHYEEAYDYFDTDCVIYSEMYYTFKKEEWTKISDQDQWVKDYYAGPFKTREFYADYVAKYGDVPIEYVEQDPVVEKTIRKREEYAARGYKFVAAMSNIFIKTNDRATVEYYHDSPIENSVAGYFACPWVPTIKGDSEKAILEEIELLGAAKREFYN
jgi:hypothetical protein